MQNDWNPNLFDKVIYFSSSSRDYGWLSNFYESDITYNSKIYKSGEHLFQSLKAVDEKGSEWIRKSTTPGIAKKRGRQLILRDDWDKIKDDKMALTCFHKFVYNKELIERLLATSNATLVEFTTWNDIYWGVNTEYKGKNILGKTIMILRDFIKINS